MTTRSPALLSAALVFTGLVLGGALPATPALAQLPADEEWATRTTENLRITYPEEHPHLGERAAVRAEAAYELLSRYLIAPPSGPVDVVISDHTDLANGWATVFPTNRTVVLASPPMDGLSLAHFDDWLDLVLVHELAHLFHLDESGGPGALVRAIFGRAPLLWPTFPGLATPSWTREGVATWYESGLTSAGRNRGSYFDMILRTAALEGRFEDLDQASGSSPVWPHGDRAYVYGGRFFEDLIRTAEGEGTEAGDDEAGAGEPGVPAPTGVPEFVHAYAGRWIPFRLSASTEEAFGRDAGRAWEAWRSERKEEARALRDSLAARGPLTRSEQLTGHGRWALRPLPAPGGQEQIAYTRSDGTSDPQIHLLPDGRKLTRTSGLADLSWTPDGDIVFAQLEYVNRYELRSDLYRVDGEGRVQRITRDQRLDHPHVAPDGRMAVAIQWGEGTNRLVEVDLSDGSVRPLTPRAAGVHWAYPRISPDGRSIAVSRWRSGGFYDVVLLNRDGELVREVTRDRAVDMAPTWSPDGRWLLWSSDRSGIWNVVAVPLDADDGASRAIRTGSPTIQTRSSSAAGPLSTVFSIRSPASPGAPPPELVQLTNTVTGALYPAVDPQGRWLYFSGYHADGWHIERIPFEPDTGLDPFPPDPRVIHTAAGSSASSDPSPESGPFSPVARARPDTVPGEVGPYSPFSTLLPRYWLPDLAVAEEATLPTDGGVRRTDVLGFRVGARTSGEDLVGRHSYFARAGVTTKEGRFEGFGQYRYAGLGNPVLGVFGYQEWDAGPRFVLLESDGVRESVVPVERERGMGVSAEFLRRRYRDALGLTVSASYVRQRSMYLTPDPSGPGDLRESAFFQPAVPDRDLVDAAVTLTADHTRYHPFSISREDGIRGHLTVRRRWDVGLPAEFGDLPNRDRSFQEAVGELHVYKSLAGPGFANHVLAGRIAGGVADGPDALAFHFEVGGNRVGPEPLTGAGLVGDDATTFLVRGYSDGVRFGRYAWSGSVEYRFPLWLIHRGLGFVPLHFDRMSGALFFDAGNAWGPRIGTDPVLPFQNPRRDAVMSGGAELSTILLPLWTGDIDVRLGVAVPVGDSRGFGGASLYLGFGASF